MFTTPHNFITNVQRDSNDLQAYLKAGYQIADPIATCMAIPTVKKALELGYVGVYKPTLNTNIQREGSD